MAGLAYIDGTSSATDITLGATPVSAKCLFNSIEVTTNRRGFERVTFCSGGDVDEVMGQRQLTITCIGFVTKGIAPSDPSAYFGSTTPTPFVVTVDTGCTYTGNANAVTDSERVVAAADSARNLVLRSAAAYTVAWITV